jgi:hypothetical protein
MKWIARLMWCTLAVPALAWQGKRLHVEPFHVSGEAEKLRDYVIADLRKQGGVELAANESAADVILGGGGEIWVRGYRSLNPRSGRLPAGGTPIYGGYLSVELRNSQGETF